MLNLKTLYLYVLHNCVQKLQHLSYQLINHHHVRKQGIVLSSLVSYEHDWLFRGSPMRAGPMPRDRI